MMTIQLIQALNSHTGPEMVPCRKLLFQHASFVLTFHFSISIVFCHNSKADGMGIFCVTFAVTRADPLIDCLPG